MLTIEPLNKKHVLQQPVCALDQMLWLSSGSGPRLLHNGGPHSSSEEDESNAEKHISFYNIVYMCQTKLSSYLELDQELCNHKKNQPSPPLSVTPPPVLVCC